MDVIQIRRSRVVAILGLTVCCFLAYCCLDFKFFNRMHWNRPLDRHSVLIWGILAVDGFCIATCLRNAVNPDVVLRATREGVEVGGSLGSVQFIQWRDVIEFKEISIRDTTASTQMRREIPALQIVFSDSIDLGRVGWPLAYPEGNTFIAAASLFRGPLEEVIGRMKGMKEGAGG